MRHHGAQTLRENNRDNQKGTPGNSLPVSLIAVDWGTTNLRLWAFSEQGEVIGRTSAAKGMAGLKPSEFEACLTELASPYLSSHKQTDIVICGMAGARQGWCEAPYVSVPCDVTDTVSFVEPDISDKRYQAFILAGIKQTSPADVMRGEETQIRGFIASNPRFSGLLCLPGTHTKWVDVNAGNITSFSSFMTGELYAAISHHTILKFQTSTSSSHGSEFINAVQAGYDAPQKLANALFEIRASELVKGLGQHHVQDKISGLLIGAEIRAIAPVWQQKQSVILGSHKLSELYYNALRHFGAQPDIYDADRATCDGLRKAYDLIVSRRGK